MIPALVQSHYSLLWGTASPAALARAARGLGYTHLALADQDNLYGLWPFLAACAREGLTPIVGAELSDPRSRRRLTALVKTDEGFRRLCRLLTRRHLDPEFSLPPAAAAESDGLLWLAPDAESLRALRAGGAEAEPAPPAAVFLAPAEHELHRLLRAIAGNTSLSRLRPETLARPDAWLAPPAAAARRLELRPDALAAAESLAARCAFAGPRHGTVLPPWPGGTAPSEAVLRAEAYAGARRRYGDDLSEAVVGRLEHELRIIAEKGFSSYFLTVREIIALSPRICGRGSGAASLVAYALGITNVCPIKHNLYFERFLNPGRTDPPDIDVDFAWDERDAVIAAVLARHAEHAAMVCNHVCFQPRMAIREVAKVYGLTDREIGQVSKRLPWLWHDEESERDLQTRLEALPELRSLDFPQPWPEILGWAQKIMGAPRCLSVHPGGVVITPRPVAEYAPVERAAKGVPIVQWEKDGTEESGLVKIDLLGNRSLAVIRDALASVRANGTDLDESRWEPEDDPATQEAVAAGRTMGCFYIESPAMRLLQKKTGVGDFEHLVIHSSIIRPAANAYIREYVRRLRGGAWAPIHPLLADVLDETFGIMVYQEDVSKAAMALAGFSHAEADGLRKILSKKDKALRLRDYRDRFVAGARARAVGEEQIAAVWEMMLSFSGYSFCKPHSASYARVSFQAAYLKVHHPAEFMAAVISNQGGFYCPFAYVSEARRQGVAVLPPDVNESGVRWRGGRGAVRVGWLSVAGLGDATRERILAERKEGRFSNLEDFLARVEPDLEEGRALVYAGACDRLAPGPDRAALLWSLAAWHRRRGAAAGRDRTPDLFAAPPDETLPALPAGDELERLRQEFRVLGFLCDRHPMALYARRLAGQPLAKAAGLERQVGRRVRLAAWMITSRTTVTKHGDPMEFVTFEDETGTVETTFFPDAYRRLCDQLAWGRPFLLSGTVEEDFGAVTVAVDRAQALGPA